MKAIISFLRKYPVLWLPALALWLSFTLLAPPARAVYTLYVNELWSHRYQNNCPSRWPIPLAASQGGAYVAGLHDNVAQDFVTVKHYSSVQPDQIAWDAFYNGTGNERDYPAALALIPKGSAKPLRFGKYRKFGGAVYVAGTSKGVSGTGADFLLLKYNEYGYKHWERRYNYSHNDEIATALAVDRFGNAYVTGFSTSDIAAGCDFLTIKYNKKGDKLWEHRYHSPTPGHTHNLALAVAVDPSGNVYVSGYTGAVSLFNLGATMNIVTLKYGPAFDPNVGEPVVLGTYPGPTVMLVASGVLGGEMIYKPALALDPLGNVHVTGPSYDATLKHEYATIKYTPGGIQQWAWRYNHGKSAREDVPTAMGVDSQGTVYVTGFSVNPSDSTDSEAVTIRYRSDGLFGPILVGVYGDDPSEPGSNVAAALAIDALDNVYVAGEANGHFLTIRYNATTHNQAWVAKTSTLTPNGDSRATAIAFDPKVPKDGLPNFYVTGYSKSGPGINDPYDILTIKYNQYGLELIP